MLRKMLWNITIFIYENDFKMLSLKWPPFCLGLNMFARQYFNIIAPVACNLTLPDLVCDVNVYIYIYIYIYIFIYRYIYSRPQSVGQSTQKSQQSQFLPVPSCAHALKVRTKKALCVRKIHNHIVMLFRPVAVSPAAIDISIPDVI